MKNVLSKIFFRFSLAVIGIENDDEGRKQNFSISPMGGVMVYQTLPAEKMKIILSQIRGSSSLGQAVFL